MKLNKLGTLPILITDDGKQLDQNLSIHAYVADIIKNERFYLLSPTAKSA